MLKPALAMYSLTEDLFGIFIKSKRREVIQMIWKLDRKMKTAHCFLERRISLHSVDNLKVCKLTDNVNMLYTFFDFLVNGAIDEGYILLLNKTNEFGITSKLVAAHPLQVQKYPDKDFDKEVSLFIIYFLCFKYTIF